ncbi:DUF6233 domain-containing protein [Streptomyces sp. NPDC046557]|uniref:DUF6233 domain-containing protein n=1 Tax=Streptomyces sp. NPDC046557 TaxID=3155372 RepID=UPI0033D7A877
MTTSAGTRCPAANTTASPRSALDGVPAGSGALPDRTVPEHDALTTRTCRRAATRWWAAPAEAGRRGFAARRRPPREPPKWLIERGIDGARLPARLHPRTCWDARTRCSPMRGEETRRAPAEGVPGCPRMPPSRRPGRAGVNGRRQVEGRALLCG